MAWDFAGFSEAASSVLNLVGQGASTVQQLVGTGQATLSAANSGGYQPPSGVGRQPAGVSLDDIEKALAGGSLLDSPMVKFGAIAAVGYLLFKKR
jgi:hypothetical protein